MAYTLRKHGRKKQTSRRVHADQIHEVLVTETTHRTHEAHIRRAWGILASLSALALSAYHPAMLPESKAEDRNPVPREPEHGLLPSTHAGVTRAKTHPDWRSDQQRNSYRRLTAAMQLAANDPSSGTRKTFNIPAGDLETALLEFSTQSGIQLVYSSDLVAGYRTSGLQGEYASEEALKKLLGKTPIQYRFSNPKAVTLQLAAALEDQGSQQDTPASGQEKKLIQVPEIVVKDVVERGRFGDLPPEPEGFKADYQTSATKTPLPLKETPQAVSVITRDSLEARQVVTLSQALETAGVNLARSPGPFAGRDFFGIAGSLIRGIEAPPEFGVLEDGFLAPLIRGTRDPVIYERIEVVKGPSSVLYGRGSAGGFINQVTKKPLPTFNASLAGRFGSFGFKRVEGDVTGPLFQSERVRGRLVLAYEDSDSFIDFVESERIVVAPSLEIDLTDTTRLLLQGTYQDDSFVPHHGFGLIRDGQDFKAPAVRRSLFFGLPGDKEDNEREALTGSLQLDQELGDRWFATLRLNTQSLNQNTAADSYAYGPYTSAGNTYQYSGTNSGNADLWAGELRLNGSVDLFDRPTHITLGVDHSHIEDDRRGGYAYLGSANIYQENFNTLPLPTVLTPYGNKQDFDGTGVYGQMHTKPIDWLSLLVGVRHDWADTFADGDTTDNQGGNRKKDQKFTWRAGTVLDVTNQISVYGLYARSFAPSVFAVGRNGVLDPETGEIYEVGVKTEWLAGRLGINAALFRIDRDKVPIRDPNNAPGENFSINAGLQRSDGFELEMNGEPLPGWMVTLSGLWLDSEFIDRDDPNFGNAPRTAADWQLGLFTSYEMQSGLFKGLGAGIGLFAIDDRAVTPNRPGMIDGYERVDLHTFYNGIRNITVALQIRNVLDEKYVETLATPGSLNQFGSPRAVLASVRINFSPDMDWTLW